MIRPALELTVYPPVPANPRPAEPLTRMYPKFRACMEWTDERAKEARLSRQKRLTDTELAAEVFRQAAWLGANGRAHKTDEGRNIVIEAAFTFGPMTRDEHEYLIISRFAQRSHYDEAER